MPPPAVPAAWALEMDKKRGRVSELVISDASDLFAETLGPFFLSGVGCAIML